MTAGERPKPIVVTDPVTLTVNGEAVTAQKGELLIDACERAGTYIPRFCYHPRMNPVGMCRMCLVEVDTGRGPALQPSCMLECGDGMVVDTTSDKVRKAQDGVLEFLLINHPLDCPVCDKGGECPLQDTTIAYGPGESRWVEEKRHYAKPIPISQTVALDRERCILCDRCTRFADEVAGDALIHFMDRGSNTQVNTFPGEPFSSYFSGNTVQICPVGALTATPYRFKARPWDLEVAESTCTTCAVGCRVTVHTSRNQVLRYNGVDSDPVNWGWLCDKGRFSFEAVEHEARLREPLRREGDRLVAARWSDALDAAAAAIREGLDRSGPGGVAVIGGARLTNEAAYAWAKLAKGVVGTDHVDAQLDDGLPADLVLGVPHATIDDACRPGGTVILLGVDPKDELPVLFLRLRHAAIQDGVRLIEIAPTATGLTSLAAASLLHRPGEALPVAEALLAGGPADAAGVPASELAAAAELLRAASGPVTVVVGRPSVAESAASVVDALGALLEGIDGLTVLPALRRGNVRGALELGLTPGLLPGRVPLADGASVFGDRWPSVPSAVGMDTAAILAAAAEGRIDTLVLLGADPLADTPDRALAERALAGARTVVAVDTFLTASAQRADVVLAAAGFAEVAGTTTNLEGRVTRVHQVVTPPGTARPDTQIAADLARRLGGDLGAVGADDLWAEIVSVSPVHAGLDAEVLDDPDHVDGVVVPMPATSSPEPEPGLEPEAGTAADEPGAASVGASEEGRPEAPVAVAPPTVRFTPPAPTPVPPRDAYSLRLVADRRLYDGGTTLAHMPSSSSLAAGAVLRMSPADVERGGFRAGERVKLSSGAGSINVEVAPAGGIPMGTVVLGWGDPDVDAGRLIVAGAAVTEVRVEALR